MGLHPQANRSPRLGSPRCCILPLFFTCGDYRLRKCYMASALMYLNWTRSSDKRITPSRWCQLCIPCIRGAPYIAFLVLWSLNPFGHTVVTEFYKVEVKVKFLSVVCSSAINTRVTNNEYRRVRWLGCMTESGLPTQTDGTRSL